MKVNTKNAKQNAIEIVRAKEWNGKIFFDMKVNGVTIYGCTLIEGKKGTFVGFPQQKGKDGKYYKRAFVELSEEDTKFIIALIEDM